MPIKIRANIYNKLFGNYDAVNRRRCSMKISARNVLKGKVKSIKTGAVNDEVTMVLSGGAEVVAIITKTSSENLRLKKGRKVYAIIKASSVMIGTD